MQRVGRVEVQRAAMLPAPEGWANAWIQAC